MTSRHEQLINAYCSGNISAAEFSELEDAMRQNADVRKTFLEYRMLDTSLRNRSDAGVLTTPQPQILEDVPDILFLYLYS